MYKIEQKYNFSQKNNDERKNAVVVHRIIVVWLWRVRYEDDKR